MKGTPAYRIALSDLPFTPAARPPDGRIPEDRWASPFWRNAAVLELAHFRPESQHRPRSLCRILHDHKGIYGIFRVEDRFVRAVHTGFQDPVYLDSCVEFFVQPENAEGYFNFEFNCGGALLASYVTDPERVDGGVKGFVPISRKDADQVFRFHTLPAVVEPELAGPVVWLLEFRIPFSVLERHAGPVGEIRGRSWRANFYKCGNGTSHPHWASWSPLDARNFHAPANFGRITFGESRPE